MLLSRSTPAQSRLLATVGAAYLLLAISPFAYATEVPVPSAVDAVSQSSLQSSPDVFAQLHDDRSRSDGSDGSGGYAPDFDYFDRSLLGRQEPQAPQTDNLSNNNKVEKDINPGQTLYFVFKPGQARLVRADMAVDEALEAREIVDSSEASLGEAVAAVQVDAKAEPTETDEQLEKRQTGKRVWISANACRQPNPPTDTTGKSKNHPQLVMYASTSPKNKKPGPDSPNDLVTPPVGLLFENGFANLTLQTNSDIYIGISAPNLEPGWFGSWHFEVAASTDGPYHGYNSTNPYLFMIDTDSDSALFITYNLSANADDAGFWRQNNPFTMYAFEVDSVAPFNGMERSLCAMENYSNLTNATTEISVTTKFGNNLPKSQLHVQGLKAGKKYNGFLAAKGVDGSLQLPGGGTVRGGGMVFQQFNFTAKSDSTCQVIFDLDFCDSVAYAVPSNSTYKDKDDELKKLYDDKAQAYHTNFSNSLAQIACDTAGESQYSLARTCKDCDHDYKNWLCSILIPRCEDWNSTKPFLQERNVNMPLSDGSLTFDGNTSALMNDTKRDRLGYNSTRNPGIDVVVVQAPYKEMLPCLDLCIDIVRSCPANLGFACPNSPAKELSYGQRDPNDVELRCNFPGAVVKLNVQGAAGTLSAQVWVAVSVALVAVVSLLP